MTLQDKCKVTVCMCGHYKIDECWGCAPELLSHHGVNGVCNPP